jgi:RES domain-containing protein
MPSGAETLPESVPNVVSLAPAADRPIPVRRIHWKSAVRIIPSVFPPADLFKRVAAPADLDAVHSIEDAFNPRLVAEKGSNRDERVVGPGSGYIMAAFTHVSPDGSRFSDGTFGVFYAAQRESVAIAETRYHRERFMRATHEAPCELDMRVLSVSVKAPLHDLRGMRAIMADIYHLTDYSASQLLGGVLRAGGSSGVVYDSVRLDGGRCAGLFRPRALSHCRERKHLRYVWDGSAIASVFEITRLRAHPRRRV